MSLEQTRDHLTRPQDHKYVVKDPDVLRFHVEGFNPVGIGRFRDFGIQGAVNVDATVVFSSGSVARPVRNPESQILQPETPTPQNPKPQPLRHLYLKKTLKD